MTPLNFPIVDDWTTREGSRPSLSKEEFAEHYTEHEDDESCIDVSGGQHFCLGSHSSDCSRAVARSVVRFITGRRDPLQPQGFLL